MYLWDFHDVDNLSEFLVNSGKEISIASIEFVLAPELGSVERRNWLVHLHYVRGEFDECLKLTKDLLSETRGMCEYANYVQVQKIPF